MIEHVTEEYVQEDIILIWVYLHRHQKLYNNQLLPISAYSLRIIARISGKSSI